jgi:hypothetical protein
LALGAGVWYGNNRLQEIRAIRPAELAADQAVLAKQMAAEKAAAEKAALDFASNSVLYGTYKEESN